jgi:hypothetical protein
MDPGIKTIICSVDLQTNQVKTVAQARYKHESWMNERKRLTDKYNHKHCAGMQTLLQATPYRKSVMPQRLEAYMQTINVIWDWIWPYQSWRRWRQFKFVSWKKKQQFLDTTVNPFKDVEDTRKQVLLFGNGGRKGGFMKLKGGGFKGPVLQLKRLLAKKHVVICCSEYRTSKLCLECGHP